MHKKMKNKFQEEQFIFKNIILKLCISLFTFIGPNLVKLSAKKTRKYSFQQGWRVGRKNVFC